MKYIISTTQILIKIKRICFECFVDRIKMIYYLMTLDFLFDKLCLFTKY